jgi:hypothetical protein
MRTATANRHRPLYAGDPFFLLSKMENGSPGSRATKARDRVIDGYIVMGWF